MKFDFVKRHSDKAEGFRYLVSDGDGFIYFPHVNYKGFKAKSLNVLNEVMLDCNNLDKSRRGLSLIALLLPLVVAFYDRISFSLYLFFAVWALWGCLFKYKNLKNKYETVEPEVKTVKEPLGKYYLKTFLLIIGVSALLYCVWLILFFTYLYMQNR